MSALIAFAFLASDLSLVFPASSTEPSPAWTLPAPPPFHCGACGFGSGEAFIHTLPAESPSHGLWGLSVRFDWQEFDRYSNAELVKFSSQGIGAHSLDRSLALRVGAFYAVSDQWTIGADLPYLHNENLREADEGGGPAFESNGDQNGLGDLSVFAQWAFAQNSSAQRYASLYLGAKLPTGETDETAADGSRLEPDHQPGSGSVDPFAGLAVSKSFGTTSLGASLVYTFAGHGSQNSNMGDVLRINLGLGFTPTRSDSSAITWRWLLELNGQWHDRMKMDGVEDENSGGVQVFVAPGLRATWASGVSWFASVGLPIAQNLNGEQSKTTFRATTGVGWSF